MSRPDFSDPAAGLLWDEYFERVDALLRWAGEGGRELGADLRTHLAESFRSGDNLPEADALAAAIDRLGDPGDYLLPMIANTMLESGTRSYNPVDIAGGLYHTILAGSRRAVTATLFAIGYTMIAVFIAIAVLKPFWSNHVGLMQDAAGNVSFGVQSEAGVRDLLGWWTLPLSLGAAALLYILLTRVLRGWGPGR